MVTPARKEAEYLTHFAVALNRHIDHLEQRVRELETELQAVMHSVDKWFDTPSNDNPATRAADAREVALQAIEKLEAELAKQDQLLQRAAEIIKGVPRVVGGKWLHDYESREEQ